MSPDIIIADAVAVDSGMPPASLPRMSFREALDALVDEYMFDTDDFLTADEVAHDLVAKAVDLRSTDTL